MAIEEFLYVPITAALCSAHSWPAPCPHCRIRELEAALNILLPGLILDLRYAEDDDDKDALRARIETVETALQLKGIAEFNANMDALESAKNRGVEP